MKKAEIFYTGTIIEVLDPVLYEVKVNIPGVIQEVKAFPVRGEIDEPRVGDFVLLKCLDPIFQSYYLYQKIKENDFIGFRSNGKIVDITPEYILLGIFNPETEYTDTGDKNYRPKLTDWVKLDKEGNLEINLRSNSSITIKGDSNINVSGNAIVKSNETTIDSPSVKITGGKLEISGTSSTDMQGPFNCIPTCPFSGVPHSGKIVTGT